MEKVEYIVISSTKEREDIRITQTWKNDKYHYLIGFYGECWGGKREPIVDEEGRVCILVAYIGGLDKHGVHKDTRTKKQKQTMWFLMHELLRKYEGAKVINGEISPGFSSEKEYKNIV